MRAYGGNDKDDDDGGGGNCGVRFSLAKTKDMAETIWQQKNRPIRYLNLSIRLFWPR